MRIRLRTRCWLVPVATCVLLACGNDRPGKQEAAETRSVDVGSPAPDYSAMTLAGDSVSLHGQRGKVLLLNVWATWCHPCRTEIPELRKVHASYAARGLQLVGVSVDAQGSDDAIRAFMADFQMNYEIWLDPEERILSTFLVVGVPVTFLIDRGGVLRWRKIGPVDPGDTSLTTAIERALVRAPAS
jgi:cytochrome c biogenesis protein CcmG, thiol:disulfide interchange protein DsbE